MYVYPRDRTGKANLSSRLLVRPGIDSLVRGVCGPEKARRRKGRGGEENGTAESQKPLIRITRPPHMAHFGHYPRNPALIHRGPSRRSGTRTGHRRATSPASPAVHTQAHARGEKAPVDRAEPQIPLTHITRTPHMPHPQNPALIHRGPSRRSRTRTGQKRATNPRVAGGAHSSSRPWRKSSGGWSRTARPRPGAG